MIVLQKGVAQCFPDNQPLMDPRSLQTKGKAMLLVGRFMEETANFESNAIMKAYKVILFNILITLYICIENTFFFLQTEVLLSKSAAFFRM